jgi:thiol:disulfide interchange protein DsbD
MDNLLIFLSQKLDFSSGFSFVIAFFGGLLVSFTPCVYPLLPVTVGFVSAKSNGSKLRGFLLSAAYVFGMAVTYSVLGGLASLYGQSLGSINNTPLVYFIVGNIFLLFGLSMLGVFNISLPQLRLNAGLKKRSGIIQALLLGLASGLVISPCVSPVLGALLVFVASKRNILYGASLLFVFAYGMGTLLILAGTFTALLAAIPKSGVWLERVKKAGGFTLILFAEYLFIKMGGLL